MIAAGALILSLPLLLALLIGVFAFFFDQEYYKAQLSDAVESRTGRPLVIDGALQLAVGMKPRLLAESIRYPNAAWGSQAWAIEVDKAVFAVDLWALLQGKLVVEDVVLEKPKLHIERNSDGVYNLAVLRRRSSSASSGVSFPWRLDLPSAEIIDGEISVATYRHWDIRIDHARAESAAPGQPVSVDFRGAVEQTPIIASATLGSWQTLFTAQPSLLSMEGWIGVADNRVRASGSAQNLLWWRGIDLELDFELPHAEELSELAGLSVPNPGTVIGHARLRQPQRFYTMALREIQLQSTKWGLSNTLSGEIDHVVGRKGIELDFSASGTLERAVPGWLMDAVGAVDAMPLATNVSAHLSGSAQALNLRVDTAKVESSGLTIQARGAVDFINGAWRGALPVSLEINPSTEAREVPGRVLSGIGALTATGNLIWQQKTWRLNEIQLSLQLEALEIQVRGMVDQLSAQPSGHLYVSAEAADDRYLTPLFDDPRAPPPLSKLSALKLEAALDFELGTMRATVDNFSGKVAGTEFSASGVINQLHRLRGIDLAISARADDWQQLPLSSELASLASRASLASGQLRGAARLTDDPSGALHLTDLSASVSTPPIALNVSGEIRHLGASLAADLDVELTLSEAAPLRALFADSGAAALLEAATPFTASGNLYSTGRAFANWGVRNLKATSAAQATDASLSGAIAAFAPLEARLHVNINDYAIAQLPPSWNIPRPRDGLLDVSLDVTARRGEVGVKNIIAELNSAGASMRLHGDIDRLNPIAINNMALKFHAFSVAALEWPAAPLNPHNPMEGSITLMATDARSNRSIVDVKIGANDLRGTIDWRSPKDEQSPMQVEADLVSERFYLREILLPGTKKTTRFFSNAPISTSWANWMGKFNGNIHLSAGSGGNRLISMRDMRAQMQLDNGTLRQTITGRMGQGDVAISLMVDTNARQDGQDDEQVDGMVVEFTMHGKQLDSKDLLAFRQDDFVDSGTFDSDIEFVTSGVSMAELAASVDGRVALRLNDARMKNQTLNFLGGDIFSNLITFINPFRSIGEYINIECGIIQFDLAQGVATSKNGLAMKTDKVTLLGAGEIDLRDESLKILLSPKARKGLGINPSSLAKIVRLSGTLAQPKIEGDSSRLLETGASVAATVYSGGLWLLFQGLVDRSQANADVCN